jgi:hypothetical protein
MQCEAAALPGMNIMTSDIRNYGESTQMPDGITYPPVDLSFIATNTFDVRGYFERWMNLVFDRKTRTVGYYSYYTDTVTVLVQNKIGEDIYSITLNECFPINMSSTQLSYSDHEAIRINVTLQYKWWETSQVDPTNLDPFDPYQIALNTQGIENDPLSGFVQGNPLGDEFLGPSDIGSSLSKLGPNMMSSYKKAGNMCTAAFLPANMTHPDAPTFGSDLNSLTKTLTGQMGSFGAGLGELGKSMSAVAGPAFAIGGAIGSAGSTLRSIDNLLSRVGIKTDLGKQGTALGGLGGRLSQTAQLNGIPGALGGVGANMGAIGGQFNNVSRQITNIPNANASVSRAISNLGNVFSSSGSSTSNASSSIAGLFGG